MGKTTMVKQFLDQTELPFQFESVDAVEATNALWLQQQWEITRLTLKQLDATEIILVIDEIQKIKNWSEAVKKEWDQDTLQQVPIKVILLGSSSISLQQGLSESLTGRFELIHLSHWTLSEMSVAFGLTAEQFVWFGGYPGSPALMTDEDRWKHYIRDSLIETAITRDILMLTRIHKPALLRRLFEVGCQYSGQILSYNKLLGQLQDKFKRTNPNHQLTNHQLT